MTAESSYPHQDIDWPRRMISVLAQAEPASAAYEALGWNLQPTRRRPNPRMRYKTGPMHSHAGPELCLLADGQGILEIETTCYRLHYPALVVIPPGVLHSESFAQKRLRYTTMWATCNQTEQKLFANSYSPYHGWSCPWLAIVPQPYRDQLRPWFDLSHAPSIEQFERFRATLLAAAGELARQAGMEGGQQSTRMAGHLPVLQWVQNHLDRHYAQPLTVRAVASKTCYSPHYLDALFARWMGRGIRGYLIDQRMREALRLCQQTDMAVKQIARRVGYHDEFYFSRAFGKYHGRSPSQARVAACSPLANIALSRSEGA